MTTNNITGDRISTKLGDADAQRRFNENFDRIFGGEKPKLVCPRCKVDRFKAGCPGPLHMCPMREDSQ